MPEPFSPPPDKRNRIKSRLVLLGFLAVATFFLLTEHRAHVLGVLPYLFLLACPFMHMFMHHGRHIMAPPTQEQRIRQQQTVVPHQKVVCREQSASSLRLVVFGSDQLSRVHPLRSQFCQAAVEA